MEYRVPRFVTCPVGAREPRAPARAALPLVSNPAPDYLRELPARIARNLGASPAVAADAAVATLLHATPALRHIGDFENAIGIVAAAQIRMHSMIGAEIVASWHWHDAVCDVFRHHHDHFDGDGTPLGLRGTAIPFAARIVAVTNTFEILRRRGTDDQRGLEEALIVVKRYAGTRFDPEIVDQLLTILRTDAARAYTLPRHRRWPLPAEEEPAVSGSRANERRPSEPAANRVARRPR